jgi:hypothetical protein
MGVPLKATDFHITEHPLELALTMLDYARREQNNDQLPANNGLSDDRLSLQVPQPNFSII